VSNVLAHEVAGIEGFKRAQAVPFSGGLVAGLYLVKPG
jgi:hypothetical protein